jgi:hypothetical protein
MSTFALCSTVYLFYVVLILSQCLIFFTNMLSLLSVQIIAVYQNCVYFIDSAVILIHR